MSNRIAKRALAVSCAAVKLEKLEARQLLVAYPYDPGIEPGPDAPPTTGTIEAYNFDTQASTSGFYFIPPDNNGAVGPTHVVNIVNCSIQYFTKAGVNTNSQRLGKNSSTAVGSFFAAQNPVNSTFDPKVIYDQYNQRFVVVTLERDPTALTSRILLAVSDDSDPNGTWYTTAINSKTNISGSDYWADYPGFAVDANGIYITANMFSFASNSFGGSRLWIVSKSGLYTGGAPASVNIYNPSALAGIGNAATLQPTHMFGTAPGTTGVFLVSSSFTSGANELVAVIRVQNPLASPTFTNAFVNVGDIGSGSVPGAPQLGTATTIDAGDTRMYNAVWRNNAIWAANTINPTSGVDAGQATVHWYKITADASTIALADQGNIGAEDLATGTATYYPAIMVDSGGNMGIGFSASASTIYAGAYYTGRLASDPAGTVQSTGTLAAGLDYYIRTFSSGRNRWGDYSGIGIDPTDESTFWIYNQYAIARGTTISGEQGRWGTRWGKFGFVANGTVAGTAWVDRNSNGVIDGGEPTLNGATVWIDANLNGLLDGGETSTTTSGAGAYSMPATPGTPRVRISIAGYIPTVPAGGFADVAVLGGSTTIQNFGLWPTVYTGTNGDDSWRVQLSGANQQVTESLNGGGAVVYTIPVATLGANALTFNGGLGDDTSIADYIGGNAIPSGGVTFNGGGQGAVGDTLKFNGSGGADIANVTASQLTNPAFAGVASLSGIENLSYAGAGGADQLNVNGGNYGVKGDLGLLTPSLAASVNGVGVSLRFDTTQHLTNLTLTTSGRAILSANGSRYLHLKGLSIAGTSALDLNDNDLIVEYGTSASPFTTIRGLVFAGYSGSPDPSKTGIVSSTGQTAGNTILALLDNALVGSGEWPIGSGNAVPTNAIVGKYTYFGDANLDGQVSSDDYSLLDSNVNTTPPPGLAWLLGDANLDGSVSADDYSILDSNLGAGVGNPL